MSAYALSFTLSPRLNALLTRKSRLKNRLLRLADSFRRVDNKATAQTIDPRLQSAARVQVPNCCRISAGGENCLKIGRCTEPVVCCEPVSINVQARGWRDTVGNSQAA